MKSVKAAVLGAVVMSAAAGPRWRRPRLPPLRRRQEVRDLRRDHRDVVRDKHESRSDARDLAPTARPSPGRQSRRIERSEARRARSPRRSRRPPQGPSRRSSPTSATCARIVARSVATRHAGNRRSRLRHGGVVGRRLHPAAQHLRHAPGLRDAAAGRVRSFGVEDLADRAEPESLERRDAAVEKAPRAGAIVGMQLEPRVDPRTDQPPPDRSLVIRGVARAQIAEIALLVVGLARRERPKPDRRQQSLSRRRRAPTPSARARAPDGRARSRRADSAGRADCRRPRRR